MCWEGVKGYTQLQQGGAVNFVMEGAEIQEEARH